MNTHLCARALVLVCGLAAFGTYVDGYGFGAPPSTCYTRYPKHRFGTQTSVPPYVITFNSATYRPDEELTVTVSGANGQMFKGLEMLAFRSSGNTEEVVGQFTKVPADKLKTMTCFGGYNNLVTHLNNRDVDQLVMTWKAPNQNVGNITFKATVVQNFETFWTSLEAHLPSHDPDNANPAVYQSLITTELVKTVSMSDCGSGKSCFLYPRHCDGDDCVAAASFEYRKDQDDFVVEIYSHAAQNWVSVGFSEDEKMSHDETYTCVSNRGFMNIQHGFNPDYYNERLLTRYISDGEIRHVDGRLECRFVMAARSLVYRIIQGAEESAVYENITFDHTEPWYIQLAWGKVVPVSDVITLHNDMPAVTATKATLSSNGIYRGAAFHILVQVHGALMIIAWIFLTGIVTVISRHFREWMPRTRICGTKVWFQVHRELAILIVVLTGIGLAVIFAHYGVPIREEAIPHAYVGLAVTAAVGTQVIAGMLRPGTENKLRVFFNWGHRALGHASHILSAVTMFLAFDIKYFTHDMRKFGFAVLAVWVAVQLIWHIIFEIISWRGQSSATADPKDEADKKKEKSKSNFQALLLALYIVTLAGLCVAALLAFLLF